MGNSLLYNTQAINFIKILYRMGLVFVALMVILLFALKFNDTVNFTDGYIFSNSPQTKINAPNEVRMERVLVKEGQNVKKGDTLFILENLKSKTDFNIASIDVNSIDDKMSIIDQLIRNAREKQAAVEQLMNIQRNIYQTERSKAAEEIESLSEKLRLGRQQSNNIAKKYISDSILYAKGAISYQELMVQQNQKLTNKQSLTDLQSALLQKEFDYDNLGNSYQKSQNDLKQTLIELKNQIANYEKDKLVMDNEAANMKYSLEYFSDEMNKLVVLAPYDGTVSTVFNTKQNMDFIPKGELLAIVTPVNESYYAKITLEDRDLTYIRKGQEVVLKVDAYNYYKYGAVRGNITYIAPADVNKTFYCLVNFKEYNDNIRLKAGFKLKGEVIVEELRLYEYILKKLFNGIDKSMHPEKKPISNVPNGSN